VLCQITPAGLRLLERLDRPMDQLDEATAANLTDEQIDHLLETLAQIRENTDVPE